MPQPTPLCQPYDPFRIHPAIYDEVFLPAKIHISLRPFYIADDLPLINDWLNFQFTKTKDPFQYTEDYYTTLLDTPNSQTLMGMIDRQPAFQADIYQAMLGPDRLIESIALTENDYILQLMLSPGTIHNLSLSTYTLLASLDCIFQFNEVQRVIWMTDPGEKDFHLLAGIAELAEMNLSDQLQSFYTISKQRFRQIQFGLPLFPDAEKKPQIA